MPPLAPPLCLHGHTLAVARRREYSCDSCGREGTDHRCGTCDYDLCKRCFNAGTWTGGGGRRVALLRGGGFFELPHGDTIQGCDEDCVKDTDAVLRASGFDVVQLCVDQLGSDGPHGKKSRAALANCCVVVVPGGHDVPQAIALGKRGKAALSKVLERGGGLVGICAGAFLLGEGFGEAHCYRWLPVTCDLAYGDNGLTGLAALVATEEGAEVFGGGLEGDVEFDESPSMLVAASARGITVDAAYAVQHKMGKAGKGLRGGAAVVRGQASCGPRSAGRMVLIGPHFELTEGVTKGLVVAKAVDWAAGPAERRVRRRCR